MFLNDNFQPTSIFLCCSTIQVSRKIAPPEWAIVCTWPERKHMALVFFVPNQENVPIFLLHCGQLSFPSVCIISSFIQETGSIKTSLWTQAELEDVGEDRESDPPATASLRLLGWVSWLASPKRGHLDIIKQTHFCQIKAEESHERTVIFLFCSVTNRLGLRNNVLDQNIKNNQSSNQLSNQLIKSIKQLIDQSNDRISDNSTCKYGSKINQNQPADQPRVRYRYPR